MMFLFTVFIFTCTFICTLSLGLFLNISSYIVRQVFRMMFIVLSSIQRFTVCQFAPSTMFNRFVCLLTFLLRFSLGQFLLLFKFPRASVRQSVRTVLVLSSYISPFLVRMVLVLIYLYVLILFNSYNVRLQLLLRFSVHQFVICTILVQSSFDFSVLT